MKSNLSQSNHKNIQVGKFYFIHDGSKTGHPGLIVWKDDEKNRYLVVRFDSDKFGEVPKSDKGIRHITKLSHPTDNVVAASYVRNRPMICKRKDIGHIVSTNMKIHPEDQKIIYIVSRRNPEYSQSFKR